MDSYDILLNMYEQKKVLLSKLKELNNRIKAQEKLVFNKRLQILAELDTEDIYKTLNKIEKKLEKLEKLKKS